MKKIILSSLIVLITVSVFAQQYVDLGLPSGTLWKDQNESGLYTYQEAEKSFGKVMPTAPQLIELVNFCTWEWTGAGYKITGPNGKSIVFPAEGYYTCGNDPSVKSKGEKGQYWSKTVSDNSSIAFPEWKFPYCLSVSSASKEVHFNNPDCCKFSIRLVSENETAVSKAKILQQLSESEAQAIKTEAEEQRKREEEQKRQAEEQKRQEELRKIETEAKQKAMEEEKRLEAECISLKDIDGNQYALIQIGDQCWMRENLRTTHYANGTEIQKGGKNCSYSIPYRYYPNVQSNIVLTYGYLYNWAAAMHGGLPSKKYEGHVQGICPKGWHVPCRDEFMTLLDYVESNDLCQCSDNPKKKDESYAKALASTRGWLKSGTACEPGYNSQTNNATGFDAMPAGVAVYNPVYDVFVHPADYVGFGMSAVMWSSTEENSKNVFWLGINYNSRLVLRKNLGYKWMPTKPSAASVRCLRGEGFFDNNEPWLTSGSTENNRSTGNNQNSAVPQPAGTRNAWLILGAPYKSPTYNLNPLMTPYLYPELYAAPSSSSSESSSIPLQSAVSHYVPIGTATGIKITESGSYTSITCPVESWNGSGPPSAVIDGEHYTLVRSSSSTCSGVNVSQYKYVGFITNVLGVAYTIYVNF